MVSGVESGSGTSPSKGVGRWSFSVVLVSFMRWSYGFVWRWGLLCVLLPRRVCGDGGMMMTIPIVAVTNDSPGHSTVLFVLMMFGLLMVIAGVFGYRVGRESSSLSTSASSAGTVTSTREMCTQTWITEAVLMQYTVEHLRAWAREMRLKVGGPKEDLVRRIHEQQFGTYFPRLNQWELDLVDGESNVPPERLGKGMMPPLRIARFARADPELTGESGIQHQSPRDICNGERVVLRSRAEVVANRVQGVDAGDLIPVDTAPRDFVGHGFDWH